MDKARIGLVVSNNPGTLETDAGSSGSKASLVYTDVCLKKTIHKINDKYTFLVKI